MNNINGNELYCTKALNGKDVEILFLRRKSLCKLQVTKDFAIEHFKLIGEAKNLEGQHIAIVGDFIIKGVQGEFYQCKPDIFAATYDLVCDNDDYQG